MRLKEREKRNLQVLESSLSTVSLVWEHTTNDVLEHLGWGATVEWTTAGLGQMTLAKILHNLQLVTVEVSRDDKTLATDDNDLLAVEKGLGDHGGQATHEVLVTINDLDCVELVHCF